MGVALDIVGGNPKVSWIKLNYTGMYDFDKFYRDAINWFKSNGYFFHEKNHIEAVKPTGKDHIINFIGTKEVDDYVKYTINVEIWAVRTMHVKGEKKMVKGEIQIRIKGSMELDYKNKFEKIILGKMLRTVYHKYIIRSRVWGRYAGTIYTETNDLIANIKSNLGLITI